MFSKRSSDLECQINQAVQEFFPYAQSIRIRGHIILDINQSVQIPVIFSGISSSMFPVKLGSKPWRPTCDKQRPELKQRNRRKTNQPTRYDATEHYQGKDEQLPQRFDDDTIETDENGALNLSLRENTFSGAEKAAPMDNSPLSHFFDANSSSYPLNSALNFPFGYDPAAVFPFLDLSLANVSSNLLPPSLPFLFPPVCDPCETKESPTLTTSTNSSKDEKPSKRKSTTGSRRSHLNRVFTCNQCKERFPTLSLLSQHTTKVHTFYRCVICQAQFTQRSNLQRHALKHVGFKPFLCRLCDKAYYRKDHLMRHLEMSHPLADPQKSIEVKLTYSECLDFLEQKPAIEKMVMNEDNSENTTSLNNETPIQLIKEEARE